MHGLQCRFAGLFAVAARVAAKVLPESFDFLDLRTV